MYRKFVKRLFDIVISVTALIFFSPFLFVISLIVMINLGTPVLFKQERIGKDEKAFNMLKFRTMTNAKDETGKLLPDKERVTQVGLFLRSSSIDELPELLNVLKGDISIIGPRPLLVEYLPYYTKSERQRHSVRGGLVPPEVFYNNVFPTWKEQFEYDVYYASHVSFMLDMNILLSAISGVFNRYKKDCGRRTRKSLVDERKNIKQRGV